MKIINYDTGCLANTEFFETPHFSDICWRSRLSFHVLNGHCGVFDFSKKKIFILFLVRARYEPSLVFRLSLVLSMVKFSAVIQLFCPKTISYGNPDLKKLIFEVRFQMRRQSEWGSGWGRGTGPRARVQPFSKPGWAWKPGWACTWPWPWPREKFWNFFSKY